MKLINLDHLAYSPVLPEAKELMMSLLSADTGNPLSKHALGDKSKKTLEEARSNIALLIGSKPEEIIFTSCGSESNNLAIKGAASAHAKKGKHIIASPIEHHSVIHPLKNLEKQGYEVSWLRVDEKGFVDPQEVEAIIREDTILISVASASNEIGTLEPIEEIGKIAKSKGIPFHTDAVACAGIVEIDVNKLNVDLLSVAGNVFYGPLGTGALYVRKGIKIMPLIEGGVQEMGLRAGTHNIAGIAGMGLAARIAKAKLQERSHRLLDLREKIIEGTLHRVSDCFLTGDRLRRLPGHASFCIKFIEGESILLHLNFMGIAGTSGSTCSSEALKVSHVLDAMGIDPVWAQGSVVFTAGIDNTDDDVELFLKELPLAVENLRKMSPLTASNINEFKKMKH
ncbi:MAG: cysteine desulfurase NifS [Omnitrophica bacterium RIFCSPLOWO2_02_FULL_45_16]|nr:MAG: cysteine desulfurase NifS [Omnitrophica bacterium RIFCSPHIGHO2_02_FULL_46_20]OGW93248.1 MAG: cysteine desulfurase NifS [Omnitrophica bacterium RIFCSPLOWO2_12_FULL_45_13]OGW93363.1 MAG: cysteine desulfurase NifS [Omnitrophica bacterium RIFCSPLOWO2_01_FULL_45_24]OGX00403.1 MAG: cysteine desulfurase NifS [Omnitrophica bacterium RIFCSPLOWO2_02_FULL_45_16]